METLAWSLVSILGVATVLLAFAARLIYVQGEKWRGSFLGSKEIYRSRVGQLEARISELETENEVLQSITKAQADRAEAYGLNDPILVKHPDGHLYPEETFIREEP